MRGWPWTGPPPRFVSRGGLQQRRPLPRPLRRTLALPPSPRRAKLPTPPPRLTLTNTEPRDPVGRKGRTRPTQEQDDAPCCGAGPLSTSAAPARPRQREDRAALQARPDRAEAEPEDARRQAPKPQESAGKSQPHKTLVLLRALSPDPPQGEKNKKPVVGRSLANSTKRPVLFGWRCDG